MQPRNLIFHFVAEGVKKLLKLSGHDVDTRLEFRQTVADMMHQQLTTTTTPRFINKQQNSARSKGSPYSTLERRVLELIPVLGSQPAGDVSHKPGGRLQIRYARAAVTLATLKRAATNFAAWWTEARWVWTVCLRLLPDSVASAI